MQIQAGKFAFYLSFYTYWFYSMVGNFVAERFISPKTQRTDHK